MIRAFSVLQRRANLLPVRVVNTRWSYELSLLVLISELLEGHDVLLEKTSRFSILVWVVLGKNGSFK